MILSKFITFAILAELCQVPVWLQKQIVDKHVIHTRCKEELELLAREMTAFTKFYREKIRAHEEDVKKIEKGIMGIQTELSLLQLVFLFLEFLSFVHAK